MCGIAAAGLVLTAISTAASIKQGADQASATKKEYRRQRAIAETELALRTEDRERRMNKILGQQRALYGASGVTLDGTPSDVFESTSAEFAREQYQDEFSARNRVGSYDALAASSNYNPAPSLFGFGKTALEYGAARANRG